jgi:hypothetical protein
MSATIRWFLLLSLLLLNCAKIERPVVRRPNFTASARPLVLESGRGTGPYDTMTYATYESSIRLIPRTALNVTSLVPDMWYSNGTSGYLVHVRDESYQPLAAQAGLFDSGDLSRAFADRSLDEPLELQAGVPYTIVMSVWTTKSIGIYTTGSRTTDPNGLADYSVLSASIPERGAIAFKLLK